MRTRGKLRLRIRGKGCSITDVLRAFKEAKKVREIG
jgi:hypothetical protein